MKNLLKVMALIPFLFGMAVSAQAGNGRTVMNFLRENVSARQSGMGGVFASVSDDAYAMVSNPAGLVGLARPEVQTSYMAAREQSQYAWMGYAHPVHWDSFSMAFGGGLYGYTAGRMDINYADGTGRSVIAEQSYSGFVSLAARFGRWFSVGVTPKYARSTLAEQFDATALAADAGLMVSIWKVGLGAAIQNAGQQTQYKSVKSDLPRTQVVGGSIRLCDSCSFGSLTLAGQEERVMEEEWKLKAGAELALAGPSGARNFFLRGGYRFQSDDDYSIGVGVRESNLEIAYAFINAGELERTHRGTVTFRFGKEPEVKALPEQLLNIEEEKALKEKVSKEVEEIKAEHSLIDPEKEKSKKADWPKEDEMRKPEKNILIEDNPEADKYQIEKP